MSVKNMSRIKRCLFLKAIYYMLVTRVLMKTGYRLLVVVGKV